jgi:hypothetical protein
MTFMSAARVFVDSNILVYATTVASDRHRRRKRVERLCTSARSSLHAGAPGVLRQCSAQGDEPLSKRRPEARRGLLELAVGRQRRRGDPGCARHRARYGISFWDSLIVQAALSAGVETLFSEDLGHGQIYATVEVRNPLLA